MCSLHTYMGASNNCNTTPDAADVKVYMLPALQIPVVMHSLSQY